MKRRMLCLFLALGCIFNLFAAGNAIIDREGVYQNIRSMLVDKNPQRAIEIYELYKSDMQDYAFAPWYYEYAKSWLLIYDGDFVKALSNFNFIAEGTSELTISGEKFPDVNTIYPPETLALYAQGRIFEEDQMWDEALKCYIRAGNFEDSVLRMFDMRNKSANPTPSRYTSSVMSSGVNSLNVSWTDSQAAEGYDVKWVPVGGGEANTLHVTGTSVSIGGLLPDTEYSVLVLADNDSGSLKLTAKTEGLTELKGVLTMDRITGLMSCSKNDAENYSLDKLFERGKLSDVAVGEDGRFTIEVNYKYAEGFTNYYQSVRLINRDAQKTSFKWQMILRLDDKGTYSISGTSQAPQANMPLAELFVLPTGDLLKAYFNANVHTWPDEATGCIELYIDDMYAGRINIRIDEK